MSGSNINDTKPDTTSWFTLLIIQFQQDKFHLFLLLVHSYSTYLQTGSLRVPKLEAWERRRGCDGTGKKSLGNKRLNSIGNQSIKKKTLKLQ